MYKVIVKVKLEDGTENSKICDFWTDAADWIVYLAEGNSLPKEIKMEMIRG